MCFSFLYEFYLKLFLLYVELSEICLEMYIGFHVKYPLFLSDFNETGIFSTDFEKTQRSNFMKIRPMEAELFNADGWTDGRTDRNDENNSRFSQFCESA